MDRSSILRASTNHSTTCGNLQVVSFVPSRKLPRRIELRTALRGSRNVPATRFAEQGRQRAKRASPADAHCASVLGSPRLLHKTPGRSGNGSAFSAVAGSQPAARRTGARRTGFAPFALKTVRRTVFAAPTRRRANSRASTNNSTARINLQAISFALTNYVTIHKNTSANLQCFSKKTMQNASESTIDGSRSRKKQQRGSAVFSVTWGFAFK